VQEPREVEERIAQLSEEDYQRVEAGCAVVGESTRVMREHPDDVVG